jgi:uncharacterized protein (TIGR01777 family)
MYVEMSKNLFGVVEAMAKIALSGASGMLGSALRKRWNARGVQVLHLVRKQDGLPEHVVWDPGATPAMRDPAPLEGCTAAIHLSGANLAARRWTEGYKRELVASRVESTRALAGLLAGLRQRPEAMIVASAVGFYGERGDEVLNESSAPGVGFLADMCREWEAAAEPARAAGIRIVHLRFGVALGRGQGALEKMLPAFRLGLGGRLGSGRQWISWISLEDVVAAIEFAVKTPTLAGPVNMTSPNPVRNAEFVRALGRQLNRPAILPAPAFALRLALGEMADEALLTSTRALPAKLLDAGFRFAHPTLDEALAVALR